MFPFYWKASNSAMLLLYERVIKTRLIIFGDEFLLYFISTCCALSDFNKSVLYHPRMYEMLINTILVYFHCTVSAEIILKVGSQFVTHSTQECGGSAVKNCLLFHHKSQKYIHPP